MESAGTVHVGACTSSTVLMATLGGAMASGGFTYALFGGRGMSSSRASASSLGAGPAAEGDDLVIASTTEGESSAPDKEDKEYDLILRLLSGDERTMFRTIVESGGEALQRDLILRTNMSNAKVSRVLDRLEGKGLITKERYGSTNRIEISVEKGSRPFSAPSSPD